MTLAIDPQLKARELHEVIGDIRELLLLRMRRKDASATRVVVIGELLNHFDEIEAVNGTEAQTEGATATGA